jgi:ADP-heptose:LPS heptosyltransferase
MPAYSFIQFGTSEETKINGAIDFRGKISFSEATAIVKHSLSFVGINSSSSHVTNAFGTSGVVLFGASNPETWGHENNINLYKNIVALAV